MKVSFITKHNVANYGSVLQTYATQEVLKAFGCESELIDYVRYDLRSNKIHNTILKNQPKWNKNIITRLIYRIIQIPNYRFMNYKFKTFRNKLYENVTRLYGNNDELKNNPPTADVYCAGSDQIWGKNGREKLDEAYFLDFVPKNSKCISYASSIGMDSLSNEFERSINRTFKTF